LHKYLVIVNDYSIIQARAKDFLKGGGVLIIFLYFMVFMIFLYFNKIINSFDSIKKMKTPPPFKKSFARA